MEDRCILCGSIIPEGRQVCPTCDNVSWEILSIDEIIGHCKRQVQRFDDRYGYGYFETASLESTATKEYWEHKQVAKYLEELKSYREEKVNKKNSYCEWKPHGAYGWIIVSDHAEAEARNRDDIENRPYCTVCGKRIFVKED